MGAAVASVGFVGLLKGILEDSGRDGFRPRDREELRILLDAFLLDKAIYELSYERATTVPTG